MSAYLLRRFGQGLLVLWAAFTLTFFLLQVLPGDAVLIKFQNPDLGLSPAQIADMRLAYGADSPLWRQYLHTLLAMLHGDFGYSLQAGLAVSSLIASNLPDTLSLALPAFLLAVALAFALAFASRLPGLRWLSNLLQSLPVLFISLPTFWLGIALIQLFSFQLRWIPVINPGPLEGLILPVIAVALPISAPLAQILMRSMDQVAVQPFVAVARAKGMSETGVLWHHVMGNALLPALNIAGLLLGELIAGALTGRVESTIMRLVDVLLAIPSLLLQLTVIILLGFGTVNAAVAVGVAAIASFARLARAEVVRVRHSDYVEAARGSGGTFFAVFWRHILPNSLTAVLAFATLQFGQAMLALATLSFLGYGTPPPVPEWGLLIAEGRNYLSTAWWLTTFPGLAVVAVVLAANRLSRQWSGVRP